MISVYIREQQRYTKEELLTLFELKTEDFSDFVKRLKIYGILKLVKATSVERDLTDLMDEEFGLMDEESESKYYFYVFVYVGILAFGNRIIKCIPKYIIKKEPLLEMKQVLQVLGKYNSKKETIRMYNGGESETTFNILAVMLYLVENFMENGYYSNQKQIVESNGMGEILWDNTINETFALVKNNKAYYMELRTSNTMNDEYDFFKRLHGCIVSECSERLHNAGISELFDLNSIFVSEERLSDFGDTDYILYRINRELDIQYVDSKKLILKTLYTYILHSKAFEDTIGFSMYGTNSFNLVWEDVCAAVFDNQLDIEIKNLPLSNTNEFSAKDKRKLVQWIEKPKWTRMDSTNVIETQKTLIPDLVCIYAVEENYCFSILDAKYYFMNLTRNNVSGQPGVADITKQYLYQLAFQQFIKMQKYRYVQNAFLFPGVNDETELIGQVEMEMFRNHIDDNIADIVAVRLSAARMYERYLQNESITDQEGVLGRIPRKEMEMHSYYDE